MLATNVKTIRVPVQSGQSPRCQLPESIDTVVYIKSSEGPDQTIRMRRLIWQPLFADSIKALSHIVNHYCFSSIIAVRLM